MSFPSANYQALTLVNTFISNWSLTGSLAKVGSENPAITHDPVYLIPHPYPESVKSRKAILVKKVSPLENDIEHVFFHEIRDTFEIACRYTLESYETVTWDNAESNVEAMCVEIDRIIELVYGPANLVGVYYVTDTRWENRDAFDEQTKVLIRVMTITLIQIRSRLTTVFPGYGGVLLFDVTNSQGNSLPGQNYAYTEAFNVKISEGFSQIERRITNNPDGIGVPIRYRYKFGGMFQAQIFAKTADIGVTSTNLLNNIYNLLASGEVAKVFFIQQSKDTEVSPKTLTNNTQVKITAFERVFNPEHLIELNLQGIVLKPSTMSVA